MFFSFSLDWNPNISQFVHRFWVAQVFLHFLRAFLAFRKILFHIAVLILVLTIVENLLILMPLAVVLIVPVD